MTSEDRDFLLAEKLDELPVPELSPSFYELLRAEIGQSRRDGEALTPRHVWRPISWLAASSRRIAIATAFVVLALMAVGGIATQFGDGRPLEAIVSENAYAAVTEPSGIIHQLVAYWDPSTRNYRFEEQWASLGKPERRRIVQTVDGRLYGQIVEGPASGTLVRYGPDGKPINQPPLTARHEPQAQRGDSIDPARRHTDPLATYRKMLRTGTPQSVRDVMVDGSRARELVVRSATADGHVVATYVVDLESYAPIALTVRTTTLVANKPLAFSSHERFVTFEILPRTPANEALLEWDDTPGAAVLPESLAPPE